MTLKTSTALFLTNQKVSVWVVEAPGARKNRESLEMITKDFCRCLICENASYLLHDGTHLHANPVHAHLSTMEVLQAYMWMPMPLRDLASPAPQTVCRPCNTRMYRISELRIFNENVEIKRAQLTATKSTFFSVDLGMVNGSHRSCERNLRVTIYIFAI